MAVMKAGVLVFPGSNCDHDAFHALNTVLGIETEFIWHKETDLNGVDLVIVPGGFSYGDYLRSGAIARFSPIMQEVVSFASRGGKVLGICNGFQILLEAGLLPGAMLHNQKLRFLCKDVHIRVESTSNSFTKGLDVGEVLRIPISHGEGNYTIDSDGLKALQDNNQIVFRYTNALGELDSAANPNGSVDAIAGICNVEGNVLGMMPHPERAMEEVLGKTDGIRILESILGQLQPG